MSGTWTYMGGASVGALVPGIMPIYAAMVADLQAKLAGAVQLVARLNVTPPTLALSLVKALKIVAALQAAIAIGAPGIGFQLAGAARLVVQIRAELAILLGLPFATVGVHAYAYDGDEFSIGPEATATLAGGLPGGTPLDHVNGVMYLTSSGAAWTAMGAVLKVH